jgi:hypothetical protein
MVDTTSGAQVIDALVVGAIGLKGKCAAQQAHITDAVGGTEIATINAILVVLEKFGLVAES